MVTFRHSLLMSAVFLAGCTTSALVTQLVPPANAAPKTQRWEHHCEYRDTGITERANQLGKEGWEMFSVSHRMYSARELQQRYAMQAMICFRRPR